MNDVQLELKEKGEGVFIVLEGEERLGEMVVSIAAQNLTVFHTEVEAKAEGKGVAKKMFLAMTDHAREKGLQVIPLCSYVQAMLKRHPEEYADIWKNHEGK